MTDVGGAPTALPAARYSALFRVREYRALLGADVSSQLGDQLAAVAVAVLVYQRSHSSLLAALGYATTYLPWVLGGPLLAALADRLPARRALVGIDLIRALLIGVAALPELPMQWLCGLVLASSMLSPAFRSARAGLVPQVLPDERYPLALSVQDALYQGSQMLGFVAGGALVVLIDAHGVLAVDAVTFLVSAIVLFRGLTERPAALGQEARTSLARETLEGFRLVAGDVRLRRPLLLAVFGSMYVIVPEAIAPAYAVELRAGTVAVGLIMGSIAAGSIVGAVIMARWIPPSARRRLLHPLAIAGTLPLVAVVLRPDLAWSLVLFALVGVGTAYQVPANAAFAAAVPATARARAFGVACTGMMGGQLLGIVAGGAAAQVFTPSAVVAGAGVAGLVALLFTTAAGRRERQPTHGTTATARVAADAGLVASASSV